MNRTTMSEVIEKDAQVREVVEHCLSYFSERLFDGGAEQWAEIEMLVDDIGISEEELITVFQELGYDKED